VSALVLALTFPLRLNETCCGRSPAPCCTGHRIACRCYIPGPKSRGPRVRLARQRRFASHFPFTFSSAFSRASRSALRRLWFSWNSGSAWLSDIVCLDASGLRAFRSASSATCCSADRLPAGRGPVISPSPSALAVLVVNRRLAEQLSAHEISRSPEVCYCGPAPMEARERSPVAYLSVFSCTAVFITALRSVGPFKLKREGESAGP
jgi:hypothetical protein